MRSGQRSAQIFAQGSAGLEEEHARQAPDDGDGGQRVADRLGPETICEQIVHESHKEWAEPEADEIENE